MMLIRNSGRPQELLQTNSEIINYGVLLLSDKISGPDDKRKFYLIVYEDVN